MTERNDEVRTEYYVVRTCAADCRLNLGNTERVAQKLVQMLESWREELDAHFEAQLGKRPLLAHHRLRVAVAGCPNACSEPQICDFGLIGAAIVGSGAGECTRCNRCAMVCREEAICVGEDGVEIDPARCVRCGTCAAVCPAEAMAIQDRGYKVILGGKLGRHPRLATTWIPFCSEEEAYQAFEDAIAFWMAHRQNGERLGSIIEREGMP